MNPARLRCIVPFCRRTAARERFPGAAEFICGIHWRATPKRYRRLLRRIKRRWDRGEKTATLLSLGDLVWTRLKRAAVEAAVGLA